MKKLLTVLSISLFATTAYAEGADEISKAVESSKMERAASDLVIAKAEGMESNSWEMLDADKDGSISKAEAVSSKELSAQWDNLDINKDEKIDTEEFAQLLSKQN